MRPILITGAAGTLGQAVAGACRLRGLAYHVTDRVTMPIGDEHRVATILDLYRPWAVINAAGWSGVDAAENDQVGCYAATAHGADVLTAACAHREIHCATFSSALVFDGSKGSLYDEMDAARPLSVYGRCLARADECALAAGALVVRTGPWFSPYDQRNTAAVMERTLLEGRQVTASTDHVVTPTYLPDLIHLCLDLIIDGERGLWHLTSGEAMTELEFAERFATALGAARSRVSPEAAGGTGRIAFRPSYAALGSRRGLLLPSVESALERYAGLRQQNAFSFT